MQLTPIDAPDAPRPAGGYAQAMVATDVRDWLYVSGQIPEDVGGVVPDTFEEQADLAWANVRAQLEAAGMGVEHLVKVTTYLSSRDFNLPNRAARVRALGGHSPALTVIITGIFEPRWLLEIEAIAAR